MAEQNVNIPQQQQQEINITSQQVDENQKLNQQNQSQLIENQRWFTEAYDDFKDRICMDYLVVNDVTTKFEQLIEKLEMKPGNSTVLKTDMFKCCAYTFCCLIVPYVCYAMKTIFKVPNQSFAMVIEEHTDGRRTVLYGPGYHILGYYTKLQGVYSFDEKNARQRNRFIISSKVGDLKIATVEQGYIMHLECGGQNIILGPGIHKITEPMQFVKMVSLDSFFIQIGPEKWVTVPDGYDGISINRGKIKILKGGHQHHLEHVGDKFAKMVPKTLQTDRVPTDIPSYVRRLEVGDIKNQVRQQNDPTEYLRTTTAEGSTVQLDTMIFWKITDTALASKTAMEILKIQGGSDQDDLKDENSAIKASSKNITMLRQNVLRMCKHHITALVGTCSLAGNASMQTNIGQQQVPDSLQNQDNVQLDDISVHHNEPEVEEPLLPSSKNGEFNQQKQKQQNQQQQRKTPISIDQDSSEVTSTFEILGFLQNEASSLIDLINEDLFKIGCILENICIYSVTPEHDVQAELDRQTISRVSANTSIIKALSKKEASVIQQEIMTTMAKKQAQSDAEIMLLRAKTTANSETTRAFGQAESIKIQAGARKTEAEELQSVQIASELAQIRTAGEAGKKIFKGSSNNFVFGKNPGDVLYNMFSGFKGANRQ